MDQIGACVAAEGKILEGAGPVEIRGLVGWVGRGGAWRESSSSKFSCGALVWGKHNARAEGMRDPVFRCWERSQSVKKRE